MSNRIVILKGDFWIETLEYFERITDGDFKVFAWEPANGPLATSLHEGDFVVFTGGTDISSVFYKQEKAPQTQHPNKKRDAAELAVFKECVKLRIPMIGICRGAQLLHALSGGKILQDFPGHQSPHRLYIGGYDLDLDTTTPKVNSMHHQLMLNSGHSSFYKKASYLIEPWFEDTGGGGMGTFEAGFHKSTRSLLCQWHPELMDSDPVFEWLLKETINFPLLVDV